MFKSFIKSEDGAVTVDWVVLTGAVIGLGVAVMTSVGSGTTDLAVDIEENLTDSGIMAYMPPALGEMLNNNVSGGQTYCPAQNHGPPCTRTNYHSTVTTYAMDDGTEWVHQVYSTGRVYEHHDIQQDTWQDGDGNFVDAPRGYES